MDQAPTGVNSQPPRSTFVTAVGWIFTVLGIYGILSTSFGVLMLHSMGLQGLFENSFSKLDGNGFGAAYMRLVLGAHPVMIAFSLFTAGVELVAAIGLLRRKNWARLLFIGYLVFSICSSIVMAVVGLSLVTQLHMASGADYESAFVPIMFVGIVIGAVIGLAFLILYIWIIKKLTSPAIRAEFI